jgi:hypothetical protein
MLPLSTLLATLDVADRDYWLGHCEGFAVRSPGRRLGVVEFVRYGSDASRPRTIHLCTGIVRIREIAIPAADVEGLDPRRQTLWVRAPEAVKASASRRLAAWLRRVGARGGAVRRPTPGGAR